ncbi:MAG: lactate utilization protein C [Eggerthellaceae bacterium]|nr:lactate utilization protein C [Eggerthellaceae bacterium]
MSQHDVSLEDFLAPISRALGHAAVPDTVVPIDTCELIPAHLSDALSAEERMERFCAEASAAHVNVSHTDRAGAAQVVADIAATAGGSAVFDDEPLLDEWGVAAALDAAAPQGAWRWDAGAGRAACIDAAASAQVGVTVADAAIAETGTILQVVRAGHGRSTSLLPAVHVALVPASRLEPSMMAVMQVVRARFDAMPSQLVFITGPSNTADIELVRVEGVHGPLTVHYLVVDDA